MSETEGMNVAGFDLGSCTSTCAYRHSNSNSKPVIMEFGTGSGLTPSIVAFDKSNRPLVGQDVERAIADSTVNYKKVIKCAKRKIGSEMVFTDAKGNPIRPETVQAIIGSRVRELLLANNFWKDEDVRYAFTYPVGFSDKAKELFKNALCDAGFKVSDRDFYNEAQAAMMAVAKELGTDIVGKTAMIVDIGGGTSDIIVATVAMKGEEITLLVRSLSSDPQLGGADYDLVVRNLILQSAEDSLHIPASTLWDDPGRQQAISRWSETTKIKLCSYQSDQDYAFNLPTGEVISGTIPWEVFKAQTEDLTNTIVATCKKAIDSAINDTPDNLKRLGIEKIDTPEDIDMVVFVGGGSKVPTIRQKILEVWPEFDGRMSEAVDPQFAVAIGAVYLAESTEEIVSRAKDAYAAKIRDTSTGELFASIHIYKNDILPTSVEITYCTPGSAVTKSNLLSITDWTKDKGGRAPLMAARNWGEIAIDTPEEIEGQEIKIRIDMEHNGFATMTATVDGRSKKVEFELQDDVVTG